MKKRTDTLLAIAKIGETVSMSMDTAGILERVVEITAGIMKADVCSIYLYNAENDSLELASTVGLNSAAVGTVRIQPGEGITGRAAKQGRTLSVSDVTKDRRNIYFPIAREEEFRSILSVPLKYRDELIGVLNVQTRKPRIFRDNERRLLKTIAHMVSGAIRNARLYENVLSSKHELEKTQEKLVSSEKMAALGRLSATLSHELRNPLAGLKGATQLLLKKTPEHDERKQYVGLILEEVERLGRIVDDLVHFSRPREIRYQSVDVNKLIDDAVLLNVPDDAQKKLKVHKRLSKLPPVRADADKFKQVIVNIILNSIDAMPEGGELIISTGNIRHDNINYATLQFKDSGQGIKGDIIGQVFEPFFTTKATGVGLGLPVCKAIIEEHGGKIEVCSEGEDHYGGTTVTIEIPITEIKRC